jgi:hypothetical protein
VGREANALKEICPMNVFDIEDLGGVSTATVARPRDCSMCRECIRQEGWSERIRLRRKADHFLFSVESVGNMAPEVIVQEAIKILQNFTERVGEYSVSCNKTMNCMIQSQSSHHIYYEGSSLVRGSSGGAVQWVDSNKLFAMHCEVINEALFDVEDQNKEIADTPKLVKSEDDPYPQVANPPKKQKTCESETIRSLSAGNQGQGRAIIVSQFKRLMHYLEEIESLP